MYEHFYGFKAKPFDDSDDLDSFYLGESQKLALSSVHEGLKNGGGFIVISGMSGMGKSSLVAFLKKEQAASGLNIASISGETTSDMGLLPSILKSFNCVATDQSLPALIAQIEAFIHSEVNKGKKPILVVDEAQNLSFRSLEVLRLLSNFESQGKPSFQVILVGDNGLNVKLTNNDHTPLQAQVVSEASILPMGLADTKNYVMHHLKRVGWLNKPILDEAVFFKAQQETSGIPAEVNKYFDQLLYKEMENTSQLVIEHAPKKGLSNEELLAALDKIESSSQASYENIVDRAKAAADPDVSIDTSQSNFDDGISLEETKRVFESSGTGSTKKQDSFINWRLVGVVIGSYLLSVVIAASFYYSEISVVEASDSEVIMANSGTDLPL